MKFPLLPDEGADDLRGYFVDIIDSEGVPANYYEVIRRANAFDELLKLLHLVRTDPDDWDETFLASWRDRADAALAKYGDEA